ncbi:hypothetical protein UFOVP204_128 [uncultured Caudovirales phage]|uniref:Uncharacterized protein n=1 Tax=uncultured Caudovirales phage TaxID=2100421 RepID=A0A6J7WKE9_9CAUD|nr:hypothetical protein UFOVP204_128 [uncultured Caudovirales phage]
MNTVEKSIEVKCELCDRDGRYYDIDDDGKTISVCLKHLAGKYVTG